MVMTIETLSLGDARRLLMAAEARAAQIEVPSNIAVVDAGGNLLAFARMDGAWLGSIDIAIHKAFTARAFDMPTEDLARMAAPGKPLFGIQNTNHDRIVIFGGGAPVKVDGAVIGAIGSSGGTVDQDQSVVEAALAAFEEERSRHADRVPA
ncbi:MULTISPECIES: heme-binding protein [unclassified Sphingomonas]|uniref:GlcG/HbpS family heme-binding protein n=1 Tax=unclassified Sphingomonas TaxID=196159 RepID=UPI00092975C9|nr:MULTISPECIES: heme-binding protein [unclassified Sphingomonas]MBN8849980.1 heme-binding protein [Sphingomonas sp.]OJV32257.1 MAG: cobalamin adenosyltransferase [Sphingomonas sp. 67-36]